MFSDDAERYTRMDRERTAAVERARVARVWARRWKAAYRRERRERRGDVAGAMYAVGVFRQEWEQMRAALLAMRHAHYLTSVRLSGYDWNADPDNVTLAQGDAWALTEAALNAKTTRPSVFADLASARREIAEWQKQAVAVAAQLDEVEARLADIERLAGHQLARARHWARLWKAAAQLGRLRERVNDKIARRWRPRGAGVE